MDLEPASSAVSVDPPAPTGSIDPTSPEPSQPTPRKPRIPEWFGRWVGILTAYFSTQTVTQLTGIAAGLLLIRFLPVHEFAFYTLASSAISFFVFLSDLGSGAALVYFFRETRGEEGFPPYVAAVLSLRNVVFVGGGLAVVLLLPWLALERGFALNETLLGLGFVLSSVWFQIRASLRLLLLRLDGRYGTAYRAELLGAILRLALALLLVATAALFGWLAVGTATAATATTAILARRARVPGGIGHDDLSRARRAVVRYLLPTLPAALYFAVQGPLLVWLSATFGKTENIAQVGALGRLALVVGLFSNLTGIVFLPRLARIVDERLYLRRFLQFGAALAAVALAIFGFAALFPEGFLAILGPHYRGLHRELLLMVAGSGFTLLDGYLVNINLARSWTRLQALALAIQIGFQAVFMVFLPLRTTANVMLWSLGSAFIAFLLQATTSAVGFWRPRWLHWK